MPDSAEPEVDPAPLRLYMLAFCGFEAATVKFGDKLMSNLNQIIPIEIG